jgi:hypothetical protein
MCRREKAQAQVAALMSEFALLPASASGAAATQGTGFSVLPSSLDDIDQDDDAGLLPGEHADYAERHGQIVPQTASRAHQIRGTPVSMYLANAELMSLPGHDCRLQSCGVSVRAAGDRPASQLSSDVLMELRSAADQQHAACHGSRARAAECGIRITVCTAA